MPMLSLRMKNTLAVTNSDVHKTTVDTDVATPLMLGEKISPRRTKITELNPIGNVR